MKHFSMWFYVFQRNAADIERESPTSTTTNPKEDHLSQLLGPDNPGRLRAMGRGMSMTKLACFNIQNKCMIQMQETQFHLMRKVDTLEAALAQKDNVQVSNTLIVVVN